MPDDLDDLLRRAMKTLDDQVPSGYFEGLPDQTLARLEGSMQTQASGTDPADPTIPVAREEDSGLHDIRSLASSTKARLSSKRSTQNPTFNDDDIAAATSGAWKHVALPEPAKMVSLPSLDDLPAAEEVLANEALAERMKEQAGGSVTPIGKPAFSAWADRAQGSAKKSKAGVIAMVSVGLAAAAGVFFFVQTQKKEASQSAVSAEQRERGGAASTPTVEPIAEQQIAAPAALAEGKVSDTGVTGAGAPVDVTQTDGVAKQDHDNAQKKTGLTKGGPKGKVPDKTIDKVKNDEKPPAETKPDSKKGDGKTSGTETKKGKDGEPSFDDLLKEAGANESKKKEKPVLEKKQLTGDDFKKGISGAGAKAKGCYKGTQGMAQVKVTIAPSGAISKVVLTGQFAGTPEGNCVEAAVKSASFPPWDGGPASFSYPILLSE